MNPAAQPFPLVLYGTGKYAHRVFETLKQQGILISAACVDAKYFDGRTVSWNGLPVFVTERVHQKIVRFNAVIGFYDILRARKLAIEGCEDIFFLDADSALAPISDLPVIEEKMRAFFKNDEAALKIKNAVQHYFACSRAGVEFLSYEAKRDSIYYRTKDGLRLVSNSYFAIFNEVVCQNVYAGATKWMGREYVLFDIGANRGYTSFFFALDDRCRQIFAFEPDPSACQFFRENQAMNPDKTEKISLFEFGLLDSAKTLTFYKSQDGSDGTNTFDPKLIAAIWDSDRRKSLQEISLQVYPSSEVISKLMTERAIPASLDRAIKIDVEGSEYAILADLKKNGLLQSFALIFGECHNGIEGVMDICGEHFDLVQSVQEAGGDTGLFNFTLANKGRVR